MMSSIQGRDSFFYGTRKNAGSGSYLARYVEGFTGDPSLCSPCHSPGGLGESDFRVLEVLLHKGPMPVNVIGPKVDLNSGSVSVAVERLYKKGLVSRVESESDRRVRVVSLTEKGRRVFVPIFRQHAALIKRAFQDVSPAEQHQMEEVLKRIGRRAKELGEPEGHR
jgi:MarR family transcriptional regulator, 2-MHQ and catechol-resistance regulon repressor